MNDKDRIKGSIGKILTLYLGTSVLFLGVIFFMMYQSQSQSLYNMQFIQMRSDFIQIITELYEHNIITQRGERKDKHDKDEKLEELATTQKQKQELKIAESLYKQAEREMKENNAIFIQSLMQQKHTQDSTQPPIHFTQSPYATQEVLHILQEIQVHFPFALLDENMQVVFSNLSLPLESLPEVFVSNDGMYEDKDFIFINFARNKSLEQIFTNPPFNLAKRPKVAHKYFERQGFSIILQGEIAHIVATAESEFSKPKEIESLSKEIFSLRLEIISYMFLALSVIGVIAFFLTRLSLRPIKEQIKQLERFIKDTTHEVNTPLSVILMSTQKFDTSALSEANKKRLEHIKLSAQNLHQMYQNLIFLNFYTGKNSTQLIALKTLINERLEYFSTLLAQKHITLDSHLSEAHIHANKEEITIMLDNLLSNAIKYNHKGGHIAVRLEQGHLEITDSGYGMQPNVTKQIFARYSRFNDDKGGFGIGLSLVSEIAKKYHIEIRVQSEVEKGSTFTLLWELDRNI